MEIAILVTVVYLLWKSRRLIDITMFKTNHMLEDTLETYSHDVSIINSKKRLSQADEINTMKSENSNKIYSNKDIEELLKSSPES